MKRVLVMLIAVLSMTSFAQAAKPVSLFNGKTLAGWVQVPANSWKVTNGVMASTGAKRGEIYTVGNYSHYRLLFTVRHVAGGHYASALVFGFPPPPLKDALGAVQFGLPNGYHWDYRPGHNNSGSKFFTVVKNPGFSKSVFSRVEILVNASTGIARMAVAQPVGTKAVEVLDFQDPTAGRTGPIAFQIHQSGTFDEYKDVSVEVNPTGGLVTTTKPQ